MKKGVLVVAHGSRAKKTEEAFGQMIETVRKKVDTVVEAAYMEFSDQNIQWGLSALVNQGIHEITVVPYFLFEGIHIQKDIPEELDAFCQKHPAVTVTLGEPLGKDPRLVDLLVDRIVG